MIMGAGGPFVAFSMFTLPGLVPPEYAGRVFSIVIGAFDGSAAMMFFIALLHDHAGYTTRQLFLAFAVLPLLMSVAALWLFPAPKEAPADADAEGGAEAQKEALIPRDETWTQMEHLGMGEVVKSGPFVSCCVWAACFITCKYFYMQNVDQQLKWITGDDDKVHTGSQVFSIILPAAGGFTPVTGAILDKGGAVSALTILSVLQGLVGVLAVIPSYGLQYVTMVVLVFTRFLWFATAPFVLVKLFGARGITTVYGYVLFVAAVVNYSNYLWTYITVDALDGNWRPFMLILNLGCFVYGLFFSNQVRRWRDAAAAVQEDGGPKDSADVPGAAGACEP